MLLHHEAYRLLTYERMNTYLREAAADRRTRMAGSGSEPRPSAAMAVRSAAAWLLCAAARALRVQTASGRSPCREAHRSTS